MEYPFTHTDIGQRLPRRNFSPLMEISSLGFAQQDWQDFITSGYPEFGTVTANHPLTSIDLFPPQHSSSFPRYDSTIVPPVGGFAAPRIFESLEHMKDSPHPNFEIPPLPVASLVSDFIPQSVLNIPNILGFNFEQSQAVGLDRIGPHFCDPSVSDNSPELHLLAATVLPQNHHTPFGTSSFVNPFLLDALELQLLSASTSGNSNYPPFSSPSFSDPPEVNLPIAATSPSSDHLLFGILTSNPSPIDVLPSDNIFEPDHTAPSSASNDGPSPLDPSPSSDSPGLPFREAASTQCEFHSPIATAGNADLTGNQEPSFGPATAPVPAVPEHPQETRGEDSQGVLRFIKRCGGGVCECLWSHGENVCGFKGQVTHVKRHVARVHLEIRCALEFSVVYCIELKSPIGSSNVRSVRKASSVNLTSIFTRMSSEQAPI